MKTKKNLALIGVLFFLTNFHAQELPELIPFRSGNKWGYCNAGKTIILVPKYDEVRLFAGGKAAVREDIYWGYINTKGSVVIPVKYYAAGDFDTETGEAIITELVKVKQKGGDKKANSKECAGLMKAIKNPELTPEYKSMMVKSSACLMEYVFVIDEKGNNKRRLDYEMNYSDKKKNYYSVKEGGEWVKKERENELSDKKGYEIFRLAGEGLYAVKKDNKWGFADNTGTVKIELKYDYVNDFSEGIAIAQAGDKFIALDKNGSELFLYDKGLLTGDFHDGLILAKEINRKEKTYYKSGLYGFVNKKGEYVVLPKYNNATSFYQGYAIVKDSLGKFHFMNKEGSFIPENIKWEIPVECCTEYLGPVENVIQPYGLFKIRRKFSMDKSQLKEKSVFQYNEKYGFINAEGKEVIACEFDSTGRFVNGMCKVVVNGKEGLIDMNGKKLTEIKYDELRIPVPFGCNYKNYNYKTDLDYYSAAELFKHGLIKVVLNGKVGLIDFNGKEYFEESERK